MERQAKLLFKFLSKFLQREPSDRWLLVRVGALLLTVQVGLSLLPFKTLWEFLKGRSQPARPHPSEAQEMWRIVEAVESASRHSPIKITCLAQAMVGHFFLARRGYPVELRIGVMHNLHHHLEAHAWVEDGGEIILGENENLVYFTPLPPLGM
jgi:hypothetical protein